MCWRRRLTVSALLASIMNKYVCEHECSPPHQSGETTCQEQPPLLLTRVELCRQRKWAFFHFINGVFTVFFKKTYCFLCRIWAQMRLDGPGLHIFQYQPHNIYDSSVQKVIYQKSTTVGNLLWLIFWIWFFWRKTMPSIHACQCYFKSTHLNK